MLTLTRNVGETIIIGSNIKVAVADVRGNTVRLSIDAPREIKILREEVHQRIVQAEQIAAQVAAQAVAAIASAGTPSLADLSDDTDTPNDNLTNTADASEVADAAEAPDDAAGAPVVGTGGWTHAEAKTHTLVERLLERCATYGGTTCTTNPDLAHDDWCERCLAAEVLVTAGLGT